MSLVKCTECNKDVSDKAVSCPHCGIPLNEVRKVSSSYNINRLTQRALLVLLIPFFISIIVWIFKAINGYSYASDTYPTLLQLYCKLGVSCEEYAEMGQSGYAISVAWKTLGDNLLVLLIGAVISFVFYVFYSLRGKSSIDS